MQEQNWDLRDQKRESQKAAGPSGTQTLFFSKIARKRSAETSPIGPDVATSGMVAKTARLGSHCIKSDHLERR